MRVDADTTATADSTAGPLLPLVEAATKALAAADPRDVDVFLRRLHRWGPDLVAGLVVYGSSAPALAERVVVAAAQTFARRRPALRDLDEQRLLRPDWFAGPEQVGYVAYAERFGGTLDGIGERIGYLRELGVTYLHLMPLLQPREGADDGGYAVADYSRVRADLGTMDDLRDLADRLHEAGVALTLDLVLNHVAQEHAWARAAAAGEEPYRHWFRFHADRSVPDAYEATLPEVFPDFAPGNFTWFDAVALPDAHGPAGEPGSAQQGAWVWTTFNAFQWDLDWSNPDVFAAMLGVVLDLADVGVDCLRLDAIAFLWKRLGTTCQNEPEVHLIVQAMRAAVRVAAPSVVFKAEAIVGPEDLPAYLGTGDHAGKVCDLAYHNSLMVQLWSTLASGSTALARTTLSASPPKPVTTAWGTYVRCHDDIGWAISDDLAARSGLSGHAHRAYLSAFYSGGRHVPPGTAAPSTWARGEVFQANPVTGDARISGTLASLAGLELGLDRLVAGHPEGTRLVDAALGRIFLLHAVAFCYGGLPLLYMGDEIGMRNDLSYLADPQQRDDNRWVHRPYMDWDAAARRQDPGTVEGRIFAGITHLARVRATLPALHAAVESQPVDVGSDAVLALLRRHPAGTFLGLFNMTDSWHSVAARTLRRLDPLAERDPRHDLSTGWEHLSSFSPRPEGGALVLPPYAAWWLTAGVG